MQNLYYIFLGMAPAIFFLWYFYRKDKWQPEPKIEIIKVFFLGIIVIIPAGLLEFTIQHSFFLNITPEQMMQYWLLNISICFCVIAPIEELFKYSVVKAFVYHRDVFDEKIDGVIYMVAAAMGFSALENIMYIVNAGFYRADPTEVGLLRGLLATPAHAIFSGFLGIYLGKAKFASSSLHAISFTVLGFIIAIFLHGLYNTLAFAGKPFVYGVIPLLLITGYILLNQVQRLSDESPYKPTFNQEQTLKP